MMNSKFVLIVMAALILPLTGFAQTTTTPTRVVPQTIPFDDDLSFSNLKLALSRQLEAYKVAPPQGFIRLGSTTYAANRLVNSVEALEVLVDRALDCLATQERAICMDEFSQAVNQDFFFYEPLPARGDVGYGSDKPTLFTAYFSPDLVGSRTPSERFKNPIYALPSTVQDRGLTREQIDFDQRLAGKGLELFWVEDALFDLYILHVEGGGRVRVHQEDGTVVNSYLSYAGGNGHRFQFIYRYMVERGMLPPERAGVEAQRRYIQAHPDKAREIFSSCPSYVFFKETDHEPLGVSNIPLTEGRSLALDMGIYKYAGLLVLVKAQKPRPDENGDAVFTPFSRIFVAQDTGGAIKGNARCDLYMGFGDEAAFAAHNTKIMGEQYFLIKKVP